MDEERLIPDPRGRASEAIRELFSELGAVDVATLWNEALRRDVIPAELREAILRRGGAEFCRRALKKKDSAGLPHAQPLSNESGAKWQQLRLFDEGEYRDLLTRKHAAIEGDVEELSLLAQNFEDRFGANLPELPLLGLLQRQ